jgi:hypothetical protein
MKRFGLLVLAFLTLAPAAHAATAEYDPQQRTVRYTAGPGEENDVWVMLLPGGWEFRDKPGTLITPGAGCVPVYSPAIPGQVTFSRVFCARPDGTANSTVEVKTFDGNDKIYPEDYQFYESDPAQANPIFNKIVAYGGSGNDIVWSESWATRNEQYGEEGDDTLYGGPNAEWTRGGPGNDLISAGAGEDILRGEADNDRVFGGDGSDLVVSGGEGNDDVNGGNGDDVVSGDDDAVNAVSTPGSDVIAGGAGRDRVKYDSSPQGVTVDLDGETGDDGAPGEGDTVAADVEDIRGSWHDDTLTGSDGPNLLDGYLGDDVLIGGGGQDDVRGFTGNDELWLRDGGQDSGDCYSGSDRAIVDPEDTLTACEVVELPAVPPANEELPAIVGAAKVGETLTGGDGRWSGTEPLSYARQWLRCDDTGGGCVEIAGATGQRYTLTAADSGKRVRYRVTASNAAGSSPAISAPTDRVRGRRR